MTRNSIGIYYNTKKTEKASLRQFDFFLLAMTVLSIRDDVNEKKNRSKIFIFTGAVAILSQTYCISWFQVKNGAESDCGAKTAQLYDSKRVAYGS